jgi:hypothetical protein
LRFLNTTWSRTISSWYDETYLAKKQILNQIGLQALTNCVQSARIAMQIHNEMALHIGYCQGLGITKEEMENSEADEGTTFNRLC